MIKRIFLLPALLLLLTVSLRAWIYPEHRDIALLAIQKLNPVERELLQKIWNEARRNYENRLTRNVIDEFQTTDLTRLDFAAWPAIAGDHSCSPSEMLNNIINTDWILEVAKVAAELKIDLSCSETEEDHINALRVSDIKFQNADPEYATRAGSNNVHFLLALKNIHTSLDTYLRTCVGAGEELNAIGAYSFYHYSAFKKAEIYSSEKLTQDERSKLAISILSDEAFALHFLEDVFAAGHVAGTWGDAAQRKGTHDYYNEKGLRTTTWNGNNIIITGDAYMRKEDAERASEIVKLSIQQILSEIEEHSNLQLTETTAAFTPNTFSSCANLIFPKTDYSESFLSNVEKIVASTPEPGLASGVGELPRFRAEIGLFGGFAPSLRGSIINGGYGVYQNDIGIVGGIEAAIRIGIGLDGVLNESGDGLAFLEFGWRQNGSSSNSLIKIEGGLQEAGAIFAAIPARSGFGGRLRLPFYIIPGDLLITAPFLILFSPETLTKMGVTAVNGGLIPWQSAFVTPFGKFQIILGREVGLFFFGRSKYRDTMFQVGLDPNGEADLYLVSYRSTQIEFGILEYTPLRSFSFDQSSTLRLQFYGGIDIPYKIDPLDEDPRVIIALDNILYLGVRLVFDWRYYF